MWHSFNHFPTWSCTRSTRRSLLNLCVVSWKPSPLRSTVCDRPGSSRSILARISPKILPGSKSYPQVKMLFFSVHSCQVSSDIYHNFQIFPNMDLVKGFGSLESFCYLGTTLVRMRTVPLFSTTGRLEMVACIRWLHSTAQVRYLGMGRGGDHVTPHENGRNIQK